MFTTMIIKRDKQNISNIYRENQVFKIYASHYFPTSFVMFVYFKGKFDNMIVC